MMTSENDSETVERHRSASALLNERPALSVRATVLAAAARAVDAKPADAARPSAGWKGGAKRYQPLSAAALLVVSVLTGLVAVQAYRERPDLIVTGPVASPPPMASTDATPVAIPTPVSPPPSDGTADGRTHSASPSAPAKTRANSTTSRTPNRKAETAHAVPARPPAPATEPAQTPRRENAPFATARSESAPAPDRQGRASSADAEARPQDMRDRANSSRADMPNAQTAAGAVAGDVADETAMSRESPPVRKTDRDPVARLSPAPQDVEPATPDLWVARIVRLREERRDEEADRELARLRARFPAYVVPDRALKKADSR